MQHLVRFFRRVRHRHNKRGEGVCGFYAKPQTVALETMQLLAHSFDSPKGERLDKTLHYIAFDNMISNIVLSKTAN